MSNKTFYLEDISYSINEDENAASVIGCNPEITKITIPPIVHYESKEYPVTSILEGAFEKSSVETVQFAPDSKLQTIGKYAFNNASIKSIEIPSQVTQICEGAFSRCNGLRHVEFPEDSQLQIIDSEAFSSSSIENIKIPSQVTTIGEKAFSDCSYLRQFKISENSKLEVLSNDLFYQSSLKKFRVP